MIDIQKIDSSPYQHRKYFDKERLRELGASIVRDGLIEPIVVRLSKLDSIRRSRERGSVVLESEEDLSYKYVGQVESIFQNLPKPLEWRSFLAHDLILLTDIPSKVQKASVKHKLNKAQTKALARIERASDKGFNDIIQKGSIPLKGRNSDLLPELKLNEFSAREIQAFAEGLEKTNKKNEPKKDTLQQEFSTRIKVALMTRLGIPHVRIAQRLNIHRETISKYAPKNQELFNKMFQTFKNGSSIPDIAQKYLVPQSLVWSVILEEKTDQERFKSTRRNTTCCIPPGAGGIFFRAINFSAVS